MSSPDTLNPPDIITDPAQLLEIVRRGGRVVFYLYHDWKRTNEVWRCDVCSEFAACSTEPRAQVGQDEAEFFEVDVPRLMRDISGETLAALLQLEFVFSEPCVQLFENGKRQYTFRGADLSRIRNRVSAALQYPHSDEC